MVDGVRREADAARTRVLVAEARRLREAIAAAEADLARTHAEAFDLVQEQTGRLRDASTREREMPLRSMAAEFAVDARVNDRTMQSRLFEAHRTVTQFPARWESWHAGRVSRAHVREIVDTGAELDDEHARAVFEEDVLGYAETTSPARVRSYAEQVAEKLNPKSVQERHDAAVLQRRVWVEDLRDGMSMLGAIGPSVEVHGVYDRLTRQGKAIKHADRAARREAAERDTQREGPGLPGENGDGAGLPAGEGASFGVHPAGDDSGSVCAVSDLWFDRRSLDEIRTDLLFDMMLTSTPSVDTTSGTVEGGLGAIRAHVQVTVPATTLAGTTTGGAELDGKCAVDPETAKILAGNAPGFDRVFLDPIGGAVLAVDRRHATAAQKRYLMARDVRCRFPGCRRPARDCEWDHREDYALGGKTDVENLGGYCKRHHTLKHAAGWTVVQHPGGRLHFTAPSGLEYDDDPPPRVMFIPDPPPPEVAAETAPF
ncbi:MAG: HNH endonuclease [Microbacterium sp.]|nr:HNH endonuclease [Microbacterium sp.]